MSVNGTISERTPLSVLLYHEAMRRNQSLSSFADELEIGTISLRQFILGKTQRPRQKTLEIISMALDCSVEAVRQHMEFLPEVAPPFGEWLDAYMAKGRYSRAKLTRETKISDGALRNYLSGQTLPDADQAQRIAEVLNIAPLEIAHVIVANEVAKKGGEVAPIGSNADTDDLPAYRDAASDEFTFAAGNAPVSSHDEAQILNLWHQLHPQARRATLSYIAMLLAER